MLCELVVTWRGLIVMCCVSIMCVLSLRGEVLHYVVLVRSFIMWRDHEN